VTPDGFDPPLPKKPPRRLFLDDDPERASAFLAEHPDAVWVRTVPECLDKLAEAWDEVHLDHDLGGELFVDVNREDCGMEVVRWLAREHRQHLRKARFTVHSHNATAAFEMAYRLQELGYRVEARPFGIERLEAGPSPATGRWGRLRTLAGHLIRRLRGPRAIAEQEADPTDFVP
jgi:hypothetical protein